jgi:hypothetical protein
MPPDDGEWGSYRKFVVEELRRINDAIEKITLKIEQFRQDDIAQIRSDIALLKFQAGLWGAGAGIIFSVLATFIFRLIK